MSGFTKEIRRSGASFLTSFFIHCALIVALAVWFLQWPPRVRIVLAGESDLFSEVVNFDFQPDSEAQAAKAEAELNQPSLSHVAMQELPKADWAPEMPLVADTSWLEEAVAGSGEFRDAVLAADDEALLASHEVGFFGIEPTGNRIVYILDMSVSMGYSGYFGPRYQRAAAELMKSVEQLREGQEFYVLLFCFQTFEMEIGQMPGQYCAPTPENKDRLAEWLGRVPLGSGTDPRDAIVRALEMSPSCVFLLSDGEFNGERFNNPPYFTRVSATELARQSNRTSCPIHTIGLEDRANQRDLTVISEQSGGTYRFISGDRQ